METERIHNLTEQEYLVHTACFLGEEQEYSKRSLANDRDLAVPFKKRKLKEESDSCYISTDQNLQASDNDEGIKAAFCPKFEKEDFCESTPSPSQKPCIEGQIEFNLQSSVFVKADESAEWIRLKCFDSITFDESNSATFFVGGPIQSSAFFITPHDVKVNQYIAVAVGSVIYNNHSYTNTKNMSGIIQFWNLGSLEERKTLNQPPSMDLALFHDNGIITEMKWSPANCYDKYPSTCQLPRLGMLAAASSDSCVYVYTVPQPDFMPKLQSAFPIYFTQPSMKLTPLFGEPSNATRKAITTCVEWEKSGERIVAGYGNGSVCVWMIKVSSYTSKIGVKQVDKAYIIQPYLFFQPAGAPIASLSFAPFSNNRWLIVLSEDGYIKFFDLLDTSAPFMIGKQGLGSDCIWGESFCGIYTAPTVNSVGLVSLSVTDIYAEGLKNHNKDKDKSMSRIFQKNRIFDSSTHLAASGNGNFHAIADMTGTVLVNFLNNQRKPLETYYLTYMLLETEIISLDNVDLEMKTSQNKINISGNILRNEISSLSDTKDSPYTKVKQESSSSSSSSGFCSPKNSKTFVIELAQCFDDIVNLPKSPLESSVLNSFMDYNNNGIKATSNKPMNSGEETNDKMIKCSEFTGDLMRDLLMVKVSNQSKSSSQILPFNNSNNSAYCNSNGVKNLSGNMKIISSPAASDYTGDTIIYPLEDKFCDTSHSNALNTVESKAQSISLGLSEKRNTLHETMMHKMSGKPSLELEYFTENSVNIACLEVKSRNTHSNDNSSSKNWSEPNTENCHLNYENRKLRKIGYISSNQFESFTHSNSSSLSDHRFNSKHSDIHGEEYHDSKNLPKEIMKNVGMGVKINLISQKDATNLSLDKNFDEPLCDVPWPKTLNQRKPLPDMYPSTTCNDFIFCDIDRNVSFRAFNQSSAVSDCSDDTIIYSAKLYDYCDENYLNSKKPGAMPQSLCNKEQENTFQDISLHKMQEQAVVHGSKTKLLTENYRYFIDEKCGNFLENESLKCNSGYETDSVTEACSSSYGDSRNFDQKDILISNFHLLHSEYFCERSEEKLNLLNELPQSNNDPQKLSYANLISSFGVVFKNSLDKSTKPIKNQNHGIYVKYNPLSVIKTICWDPNNGCQSWLFVGGNSGIGRLVFVPDYLADIKRLGSLGKRKRH